MSQATSEITVAALQLALHAPDEADNIASTKLKLVDDAVSELPGSC